MKLSLAMTQILLPLPLPAAATFSLLRQKGKVVCPSAVNKQKQRRSIRRRRPLATVTSNRGCVTFPSNQLTCTSKASSLLKSVGMASLTHPAHHRHQSGQMAHGHGPPVPFSAIRFHALDLSGSSSGTAGEQPPVNGLVLPHNPLIYSPLLPSLPASHGQQPASVLVHAGGQSAASLPLPFGSFAAAFAAGTLLGNNPLAHQQHLAFLPALNGQRNGQLGNGVSVIEFGHSKLPALAENSPPHLLSLASLSSSSGSFGPDSDGRSCSSASQPNAAQNQQQEMQANGQLQAGEHDEDGQKGGGGGKKQLVRDEAYWERRRKNNDAAKRSRDSRRKKEDEVAVRAVILEQENLRLRFELERLRTEIERHRIVAFSQQQQQQEGSKFSAFLSSAHPMALAAAAAALAGGNGGPLSAILPSSNGLGQEMAPGSVNCSTSCASSSSSSISTN